MKAIIFGLAVLYGVQYVFSDFTMEDYQVLYDKNFNITCESEMYNISKLQNMQKPRYYFWILPNGDYLGSDNIEVSENERVVLGGTGYDYGKILTIKKTDDDDFGVYNCLVETFGGDYKLAVRKGVNIDGAYFGDMMEKYRTNIIIGVCAGGGLMVVCILGCLVYHLRFRHDDDEDEDSDEEKLNGKIKEINGYDNYASEKIEEASNNDDHLTHVHVEEKHEPDLKEDTTKL